MLIPFVKANACGNDFVIIEGKFAVGKFAEASKQICDRHAGLGADGVEWIFPTHEADVHARLFNADGGEAEISGNGTRCVAAYHCANGFAPAEAYSAHNKTSVKILTGAGIKTCELVSHTENEYEFAIAMGRPDIGEEVVMQLPGHDVIGISVSMGNPHFVVFVDDFADGWQREAANIAKDPRFRRGTNVELVKISDGANIEARFFERGVGETQSSGTGSCASAVAAISCGRAQSPVQVHAPGGTQTVSWDKEVILQGSARLICRGEVFV